jgi:phosphonate degradation associated HDIG domain protein
MSAVDQLLSLLEQEGARQYGMEAVSQLEHALQCALLAEQAGAEDALVVACLLHDVGHLLRPELSVSDPNKDDLHQYSALPFLRPLFGEDVLEPIRLHVDAKRYLCTAEPSYWAGLSDCSKHTLQLQGGRFTQADAEQFIQRPHARNAVRLRAFDDLAKRPGLKTPPLGHFAVRINRCLLN